MALSADQQVAFPEFSLLDIQPGFIVINKHPGVDVHREGEVAGITEIVAEALGVDALYLVHRLDKVTSGIMLLATDAESCEALARLFREKTIQKYYLALSDSKPKKKQGRIVGDMVRSRRSSWKLLKTRDNPAVTRFFSVSVAPGVRAFLLKPETGKTHQLRVALKSLGAPIAGDPVYEDIRMAALQDRTYLHAFCIRFNLCNEVYQYSVLPDQGQRFCAEAFRQAIQPWSDPEKLNWPE